MLRTSTDLTGQKNTSQQQSQIRYFKYIDGPAKPVPNKEKHS
ncbi:hypothetical protein SAMN05216167_1088 [Spirosoma endophyticum]|uniref:Uncharacterized protein n=1 Tax=Spirosoma endophyticum TaxID=662367 RepID=A0A1I1VW65_9BACT|nr:hypothetical protein SAMN05216167_1088 [Spirosoma endophyticum]